MNWFKRFKKQPPEFTFDHPIGLQICRHLAETEAAAIDGVIRRDMETGYVWYVIPSTLCGKEWVSMSLCFQRSNLDSLSVAVIDDMPGQESKEWTEDKERLRTKRTSAWLSALGYPPGSYTWGEIWCEYDPRSASGGGGVRFNSPTAAASQAAR
ncbi:MAG: hypothetical protein JNN17_26170 [Verrucomicrobiaceae bacterium]|nr:hypothetical protein [Verrucomicrobiaceae bacterium]